MMRPTPPCCLEAMHDLAHGTVVVMEGIPAPVTDYEKEEHLLNKLERDLGRIYRHPLASSLRISLGTLDGDFERDVMVRDPLGRMPDSYEVNLYGGPMTDVRTVTLIFDGVDVPTFPLIEDPVTGQPRGAGRDGELRHLAGVCRPRRVPARRSTA